MLKHLLFLLTACGACTPVLAEPGLSLAAVQARILERSPALLALGHELAAQDGLVRQAGAIPNPEIAGLVEDRQSATRSTTVQLTQSIELGGKRAARVDAAERERALARAGVALRQAELRARASVAYYQLLAAQGRVALSETALDLARQALAIAGGRVKAGKNSPVDETRARIALSGAEIELSQAQGEADTAREALAALWGGSANEVGSLAGTLQLPPASAPLPALLERLAHAPAVLRARLEIERRLAMQRVEHARRMPDLGVTVGSKKDEQLGRRQALFGLSLPLPLYDRNQGRIEESAARTEQARAELAAIQGALASELRIAYGKLAAARRQALSLQDQHLPGAREAQAAAKKGYEYGKFSLIDVFDAQRALLQAQAQQLRLLGDAHGAAADLERILGTDQIAGNP